MVEYGIDIRREYTLIIIVHSHGWIRPPEESLRHIGTVVELSLDFQISLARAQGKARHSLLVEHLFCFAHPYSY